MREYLKALRDSNNMTMQEAADKIGISRQYYQFIESGERQKKMDITLVKRLADAFNAPLEEIISEEQAYSLTMQEIEEV